MNVAVLGAGSEGRDIASLCARAGHAVSLHAADATKAMDRIDDIEVGLINAARAGEISEQRKEEAIDSLEATTGLKAAVSGSDVVIETIEKEAEPLQERFAELESFVERETIIMISSTTVSITTAAAGLCHPDRAFSLDFFDLSEASVVELLVADQATKEATDKAKSFVESFEMNVVPVRDVAGTASTRLELALEAEAMRAVADGVVGVEGIDTVAREGYQHPMGPLERADRAGLGSRLEALTELAESVGPQFEPPELLRELVEEGNTGMGAGEGFYIWKGAEPVAIAIAEPNTLTRDDGPDDPTQL